MKKVIKLAVVSALTTFVQLSFGQAVFQTIELAVSNPAAVVAAMDKFAASSTGRSVSNSVTLYRYVANGENEATHLINNPRNYLPTRSLSRATEQQRTGHSYAQRRESNS